MDMKYLLNIFLRLDNKNEYNPLLLSIRLAKKGK